MKRLLLLSLAFWLVIGVTSCSQNSVPQRNVTCTTYPVWLLTKCLYSGDVSLLVPANTGCPHDYSLSAQELLKISMAKDAMVISNGAGLDDHICDCVRNAKPDIAIRGAMESGTDQNPHQFTAPRGTKLMLQRIASVLIEFEPSQKDAVMERLAVCEKRLDVLSEKCRTMKPGECVLLMHDTFLPLMEEMNLNVAGIVFEEHISSLTPKELNDWIQLIQRQKVRLIISEPQVPMATVDVLQRETGAKVVVLDPLVSGREDGIPEDFFLNNMERNIQCVRSALCTPASAGQHR